MTSSIRTVQLPSVRPTSKVAREILIRLARRLHGGHLVLIENGQRFEFGDTTGTIDATLEIHSKDFWSRLLWRGGVGLAEAYIAEDWTSPDSVAVLRLLALNLNKLNAVANRTLWIKKLWRIGRNSDASDTRRRDRKNISAHYDLGNDFFQLFLDPTFAYSSGYFSNPQISLEEASTEKFDRLCRKLGLTKESRLLEIGTGWGGFALHAAKKYGCSVTTTTISTEQYAYATERIKAAGLQDLVTVLLEDYRDLTGQFTHLASIEMIEAVDWRQYTTFFQKLESLVTPDGLIALQAIVIRDSEFERYKTHQDFIRRYIFPGGCLPSTQAILTTISAKTSLRLTHLEEFGHSYARTLREWRMNLQAHRERAKALGYDNRFLRMWDFYFEYCEAGFLERHIAVEQLVLAREKASGVLHY
jgi:cyclopropane-fatty-acyl-phospholipid synthase